MIPPEFKLTTKEHDYLMKVLEVAHEDYDPKTWNPQGVNLIAEAELAHSKEKMGDEHFDNPEYEIAQLAEMLRNATPDQLQAVLDKAHIIHE